MSFETREEGGTQLKQDWFERLTGVMARMADETLGTLRVREQMSSRGTAGNACPEERKRRGEGSAPGVAVAGFGAG